MNKKDKKDNLVEKREIIDNATLAEMNEKYPKVSKNGVAFDLGLTYITIQTDYLGSTNIRKLIKNYGAEIVAVICFFRTEMCQPYGWYCKIDNDNLENLIEKCAFTLRMDENRVKECYQSTRKRTGADPLTSATTKRVRTTLEASKTASMTI